MSDSSWTYISGNTTVNQRGIYGEKGTPSESNVPGGRERVVGWFDHSKKEIWIFGGYGYDSTTDGAYSSVHFTVFRSKYLG